MAELRHPTEPSRFALALVALAVAVAVAVFVLVSLGEISVLVTAFVVIVVAVILIWVLVQIWRVRLLGDAVLVSQQTLPQVQEVLDTVRDRLGYARRVDVFVVDKISTVLSADAAPITLTSFFGVHVLVAEGDALGDLDSPIDRQRLTFTLATYVGALKARYAQWWSPLFTAFQMTGLTVFVFPFVYPYYRATVYSGDRIAYACCGDLDVSLHAVYRALVGKEVAGHLRAEGLTGQALAVRRRRLLRFAQLLRPTPHATNRYLALLAFVRQRTPDAFQGYRSDLGAAGQQAEPLLARMSAQRSQHNAPAVGIGLAAMVLLAGLLAGVAFRNSPVAQTLADAFGAASGEGNTGSETSGNGGGQSPSESSDTSSTTPNSAPDTSPAPTQPAGTGVDANGLLALLPSSMQSSCAPDTSSLSATVMAALICHPGGDAPSTMSLYAYSTGAAMTAAFNAYAGTLPVGTCSNGDAGQGTWSSSGATQGPLACYTSSAGDTTIIWGSNDKAILAIAQDPTWPLTQMYTWWTNNAPALQ